MAIVKCENESCKYFEEGFYCTKSIVEMTDGMCDYWTEQKELTKDQQEMRRIVEDYTKYGIQLFDVNGNSLQCDADALD
jgi:hypothetical protein